MKEKGIYMKTRRKLAAASLAVAGAATVIGGGVGAGEASASVKPGVYSYVGSGGTIPAYVNGSTLRLQSRGDQNPLNTYRITRTRSGGYADNAIGQRITLRAKGNGYVGAAYLAGFKLSDIRLVPRR